MFLTPVELNLFFKTHKNVIEFYIISRYWDETGSWNYSCKRTHISSTFNIMAGDGLAMQGAGGSAALVLT